MLHPLLRLDDISHKLGKKVDTTAPPPMTLTELQRKTMAIVVDMAGVPAWHFDARATHGDLASDASPRTPLMKRLHAEQARMAPACRTPENSPWNVGVDLATEPDRGGVWSFWPGAANEFQKAVLTRGARIGALKDLMSIRQPPIYAPRRAGKTTLEQFIANGPFAVDGLDALKNRDAKSHRVVDGTVVGTHFDHNSDASVSWAPLGQDVVVSVLGGFAIRTTRLKSGEFVVIHGVRIENDSCPF